MKKTSTSGKKAIIRRFGLTLLIPVVAYMFSLSALAQSCPPISPISCDKVQVALPYNLSFSSSVSGTVPDKNGIGTGFTMVDAYSGSRHSADGNPSNTGMPGYEASKLTVASGRLQIVTNKGIAATTSNNQLNALGVRIDSRAKLNVEVTLINPFNGTSYQQGGLWFGLNDKTYLKIVAVGNKVELRKEVNDVTAASDQRITSSLSDLHNSALRLRLEIDPNLNVAKGYYTINGGAEQSVGTALSISGMGITSSTAFAGIFATHRNGTSPVTYTFDDFAVKSQTTTGNNHPTFVTKNYSYSVSDAVAPGSNVGSVKANDPEGGAITYAVVAGNTNNAFTISSSTGVISVNKKLNYHSQANYSIRIRATDTGGLSDEASVNISVSNGSSTANFTSISWSTAANQPFNVSEAQGEVVNGKLYTFGGFDSQKSCCTPTSRAYVYDPSLNKWTSIAQMPPMNGTNYGGVTHAGFATDGTDIYFAGGYTSNATGTGQIFGTKEVWKYIVSENRYVRLPDLPIVIAAGQLEYVNGKLHHIAGTNQARTADLGNHYVLDLDNLGAGWKTLTSLPSPRQHAGSAVYEGKIYFIGGQTGHDSHLVASKEVHRYDPGLNSWVKVADLPVPSGATGRGHISSAVVVVGNRILVLGGETIHNSGRTNMVSAYTPATNNWQNLTSLPAARFSGVAALLNNNIYYTGGSSSSTTYKGIPGTSGSTSQQVVSFTLINADTKQNIQVLQNGATLNLSSLPTKNFNIRANTNPSLVGSVIFNLSGAQVLNVTENRAPYDLMGDDGAWTPAAGNYTLKATPYTSSSGSGTAGNALTISFSVTNQSSTPSSSNLLNAGGGQYTDGQSRTWSSDSHFTGGVAGSKSFDVAGTADDRLYLAYRYAADGAPFSYNIPVSGTGPHTVRLHFLEPYFGAPGGKTSNLAGARLFHVDVEGQRVLSNYDIYAQDGAGKAVVKTYENVSVSDGALTISFTSVANNAIISAIEVISASGNITMLNRLETSEKAELAGESYLRVHPNPSEKGDLFFEIQGFGALESAEITLVDVSGRSLYSEVTKTDGSGAAKGKITIHKNIKPGIYFLKAQSSYTVRSTKLIRQ
ncbi:malectin domain-containing carbohydrate-binding protein [Pontibacter ramchanderi]|uniref:Putative secreted protein (Por secretion system target) n=1 Tax=Pontibacter ramchanderi TaxID=1179743 RepID=A0A2N3U7P9_9BACT|nr:malectin domain-containing carbohydrate-binding protein [Pontibacter ramchanderi]PKV62779.1 putative secreted protein (Por secretion system target) [Pontibacter ramchanderi]